ncbi:MAG: LLM class flavin-dependent oxidoreductase [Acidobacteriia bacterium]|nr:LLM class flavin-dependent oxidoreductase [Terriglobia bacterium]
MKIRLGIPGGIMPPFDKVIQQAQRAEARGYDSAWWPCHLMGWHPRSIWTPDITPLANFQKSADVYLDPVAAIAAAGSHTQKIRMGTGVTDIVRRNPAMLAQSALTLDHITRGRFILGLGAGEACNVTPYGLSFEKPVSKLEEGLKIIRKLWASRSEPVNYDGQFWKLKDAVLGLEPFEGKTPPIWIASHGPRALGITGQLADGWLPTRMTPGEYRAKLDVIHAAARGAGRDPRSFEAGMLAYVVVDEDRNVVRQLLDHILVKGLCLLLPAELFERFGAEPPFGKESSGFHDYIPSRVGRAEAEKIMNRVPREVTEYYTLNGTPEDIAQQIRDLGEAGLQHIVLWNITAFADPARAKSSFQGMDRVKDLLDAAGVTGA